LTQPSCNTASCALPTALSARIDVPGAGPFGTAARGVNPAGTIEGGYADPSYVVHGYVRAANGIITTFDAPGAGTGPGQGTATF